MFASTTIESCPSLLAALDTLSEQQLQNLQDYLATVCGTSKRQMTERDSYEATRLRDSNVGLSSLSLGMLTGSAEYVHLLYIVWKTL